MSRGLCFACKAVLEFGEQGGLVKCYNCPQINNFPPKAAKPRSPKSSTDKKSPKGSLDRGGSSPKATRKEAVKPPEKRPPPPAKDKASDSPVKSTKTPEPAKPKTRVDQMKIEKPKERKSEPPPALTVRTAKRKADADAKLDDLIFGSSPVKAPVVRVQPEDDDDEVVVVKQPAVSSAAATKQPASSPAARPGPRTSKAVSPKAAKPEILADLTYWEIRKAFLAEIAKLRANPNQGHALDILNDYFEEGNKTSFARLR
jgi:hypothetical protein